MTTDFFAARMNTSTLPLWQRCYFRTHHGSHPMIGSSSDSVDTWQNCTSFVPFSTVRWAPYYSGWALFQRPPWQSPHGSDSSNAWLDWHQFCVFLYSQMISLLCRTSAISESTMAVTPCFWFFEYLARFAPVLCFSLPSNELPIIQDECYFRDHHGKHHMVLVICVPG